MATDRVRIYDLARELGIPNKDLINIVKDKLDISVKSHSSTISSEEAAIVKGAMPSANKSKEAKPATTPPAATVTPPKPPESEKPAPPAPTKEPQPTPRPPMHPQSQHQPQQRFERREPGQPYQRPHDQGSSQQFRGKPTTTQSPRPPARPQSPDKPYHVSGDKYRYKPEHRTDRRPDGRPEVRTEGRTDTRPEGRPEIRPESRPEGRPEGRPESRPEGRPGFRPDYRSEGRPDNRPRPDYNRQDRFAPRRPPFGPRPGSPPGTIQPGQGPGSATGQQDRPGGPPSYPARPPQQGFRPGFRGPRPDGAGQNRAGFKPPQRDGVSSDVSQAARPVKGPHKKEQLKKKEYYQKEKFQDLKPLTEVFKKKKPEKKEVIIEKPTIVTLSEPLTIAELSEKLVASPTEVIKELMKIGIFATLNETISEEVAKDIAEKLGYEVNTKAEEVVKPKEELLEKEIAASDKEKLAHRAPIVTIMGHVDHGKTTLLDSIRKTKHKLVDAEVGGITQSIGAYTVELGGKKIVFIDTPGHQAFTAMRARGAQATDIAILIVAADDGIMPQTVEAINHAKAASVPIIVAVNKVDKAGADPDRVLQQLTEHGLVPEAWGGETVAVNISALKGDNIDELLEYISLVAEVQELKADATAPASGVVIEAELDKGKGALATVLVQNGTLRVGDYVLVGSVGGKVRALINDYGERITEAGPSTPVEILGLSEVPQAGDIFNAVQDDKTLKQMVSKRKDEEKDKKFAFASPIQLQKDTIFKAKQKKDDEIKELNIIIKADTDGSAKAVETALQELKSKEIIVKIIHVGVGDISEADVMLAATSNAMIIGFKVKEDNNAMRISATEGVNIRTYDIIYQISEDIEKTMLGLLSPEVREIELGKAEVRNLFTVGKNLVIAGCYVLEGKIVRNRTATVLRDNKEIFRGNLDNLKRFKDDAKEVNSGYECGISFNKFNDLREGDIIKVTTLEEIERENLN